MTDSIKKIDASVRKLHGGEREQSTRYSSFIAWQLAQRERADGKDPSPILRTDDEREYEAKFGIPL